MERLAPLAKRCPRDFGSAANTPAGSETPVALPPAARALKPGVISEQDTANWAQFFGSQATGLANPAGARSPAISCNLLVLRPIQRAMTPFAATHGGWSRFKARVKAPAQPCSAIRLQLTAWQQRTSFTARSTRPSVTHLVGDMRAIQTPGWRSQAPFQRIEAHAGEHLPEFPDTLDGYPYWVGLDAVVTRHFLRHHLTWLQQKASFDVYADPTMSGHAAAEPPRLVLLSHWTTFCGNLQHKQPLIAADAILYQIDHLTLNGNGTHVSGTLELGVTLADLHVMTIAVGFRLDPPRP